jgi:hypothetical protein
MVIEKSATPPPLGSRVVLEAEDSQGEVHQLAGKIHHIRKISEGTWVACAFDLSDRQRRIQVTNFVFGDSRRWRFFGQACPDARISSWRGILNVVRLGAAGVVRNLIGLSALLASGVRAATLRPEEPKSFKEGQPIHDVQQLKVYSGVDDHFRERRRQRVGGDRTTA